MHSNELKINKKFNKQSFEESIVKLVNNIETFAQGSKIIAITSPQDYYYEVVLGYYLAKSYVENGKKAIVVETNYNQPLLQEFINIEGDSNKDDSTEEIVKLTSGIDVTFSKQTKFSAEVLHSESFDSLINKCKDTYDYVVLLVTPLKINNDLFALNKIIDFSLLVAKKDETVLADVYQSVEKIKNNKMPLLGVTLIK